MCGSDGFIFISIAHLSFLQISNAVDREIKLEMWNATCASFDWFYATRVRGAILYIHPSSVHYTRLRALTVSIATGTSDCGYSDELTLLIRDWLFSSEGGASLHRAAILSAVFFPIQNYMSDTS